MKRSLVFAFLAAIALLLVTDALRAAEPTSKPNIILILTDDKYQCAAENHVESTESTVNSANRPTVLNHRRLL